MDPTRWQRFACWIKYGHRRVFNTLGDSSCLRCHFTWLEAD